MKKYFILPLLLAATMAMAQTAPEAAQGAKSSPFTTPPATRWSVGLWGGNANNTHVIDVAYADDFHYDPMSGFAAGLTAQFRVANWLSLCTDPGLVQKNYKFYRTAEHVNFVYTDYTNNYLSLPLTLRISLGKAFKMYGFGGGYVGYWLNGRRAGESISFDYQMYGEWAMTHFDEEYPFDERRDNRLDAGFVYGAGCSYTVKQRLNISAEVRWYYGTQDVQKPYMTFLNPRYNTTFLIQGGVSYNL